jgi:hypothetical protein
VKGLFVRETERHFFFFSKSRFLVFGCGRSVGIFIFFEFLKVCVFFCHFGFVQNFGISCEWGNWDLGKVANSVPGTWYVILGLGGLKVPP